MSTPTGDHPPIRLAGRALRAPKDFVRGTHRAMPPEETLERIRPHLPRAGITRVADITGLDTIGIPVVVAVRPASGTLAVEAGKGATLAAAATSAAMEAIERFVAEECDVLDVVAPVADVTPRLAVAVDEFPLLRHAVVAPDRAYGWSEMWDLVSDAPFLVPDVLVRMPVEQPKLLAIPWAPSSNGLASGNHVAEALCAGLYEVIERDATSSWSVAMEKRHPPLRVDLASLRGEVIRGLVEQIRDAGADTAILWCPTDIGVPACMAFVWDTHHGLGVYKGYGCHLDPEIAMVRAVTEAVQARTIFVSGARDDLLRGRFEMLRRSDVVGAEAMLTDARWVTVDDIPDRSTRSFHGDVAVLLDALAGAGFHRVLARELDASEFEAAVVRVVVPGLEPYRFPWVATTARARDFVPPAIPAAVR